MKIKKNGVTINLTEADIKKLSKRILKEQPFGRREIDLKTYLGPNAYDCKLINACLGQLIGGSTAPKLDYISLRDCVEQGNKVDKDCEGCPEWFQAGPGLGARAELTDEILQCIENGCTKKVY